MANLPEQTIAILRYLKENGIDPILYGSQGVALHIGQFKEFGDVDLLIPERFLKDSWPLLQEIMLKRNFELVNLREHEFHSKEGASVAFASEQILLRDGIIKSFEDIMILNVGGVDVRTLSRSDFIKAYEFSIKDGYRRDIREKNDGYIISLLNDT